MKTAGMLAGIGAAVCGIGLLAFYLGFHYLASPKDGESNTSVAAPIEQARETPAPSPEVSTPATSLVASRESPPAAAESNVAATETLQTVADRSGRDSETTSPAEPLQKLDTSALAEPKAPPPPPAIGTTDSTDTAPSVKDTPEAPSPSPSTPVADSDAVASPRMLEIDPNLSEGEVEGKDQGEGELMHEIIGFVVRGRRVTERLQIDDLDSVLTTDEERWLPLLRILNAFGVTVEEEGGTLRFSPEAVGNVEVDLTKKRMQINGQEQPIEFLQALSIITLKPDYYVSPQDLAAILGIELQWNTELYEYRVQLDRKLSIWKRGVDKPLLLSDAEFVEMDLPEALATADRSEDALQFLQLEWRPTYRWRGSDSDGPDSHQVTLSGPRETLWGNVYGGQYKIRLSQPDYTWSNGDKGWRWANDESYLAQADWFEWVRRFATSEIALGDSTFGLSDLVYPIFSVTGVRINGLLGLEPEELALDRSSLGLRRYFGRPVVFEGTAPIDATVELILNGREIAVGTVFPEAGSPPGMGIYRFEDIDLPNGILNEVTIVIRETNGNEIRVEKSVMGTPQLLPKGHTAYLGVVGSKRERSFENIQVVDAGQFYGYVTGGRVLHGLTDRLTVGTVLASEEDHYHRFLENDHLSGRRVYPESSNQAGAMFSYLPLDNLLVSGDVAASQGDGQDEYDDMAVRTRAEYLPTDNLSLTLDLLNLGPHYFDGADPDVADRRGGEAGLTWKWSRKWSLESGIGYVRDNLDGRLGETTEVDYQNIGLMTTVLPRTALSARLHRLGLNIDNESKLLTEVNLRTMITRDLSLYGLWLAGEELSVAGDNRFLSLLRLRHAPRSLRPSQYWALRKSLNPRHTLSLVYTDAEMEQTVSLVHDMNIDIKNHPLRLRTEFIKELLDDSSGQEYGFRGRGEYLLDDVGYNRLGIGAEYRHGNYMLLCYLNIRNLYSHHGNRLVKINSSRIRTAYGAVHGKVFLDFDGDHVPDANEPGVPDVKVNLGRVASAITDKDGYYILRAPPRASQARVYLDISTVSAIYGVNHGTQLARIYRDSLTEVNLGLTPLISIVGRVLAADPNQGDRPLSGVRVVLNHADSDLLAADSVTATDGSYYMGGVTPGQYLLRIDDVTLPPAYEPADRGRTIHVKPTREEFEEIGQPDLLAVAKPPEDPNTVPSPTEKE